MKSGPSLRVLWPQADGYPGDLVMVACWVVASVVVVLAVGRLARRLRRHVVWSSAAEGWALTGLENPRRRGFRKPAAVTEMRMR
jgi:hypothetical protein